MAVHILSGGDQPAHHPAGRAGDRIVLRPEVNAASNGSLRVNIHGKIFNVRFSQPSTNATLNYTGTTVVDGAQVQKMEALARKTEAVLRRVYPTLDSVRNERRIRFHLHRESAGGGFELKSFSSQANNSGAWVDHWVRTPVVGMSSAARFGAEIGVMEGMFTTCENERIAETRRRQQNPPAPQPAAGNAPGNPAPPEVEEPESPRADLHLAPHNKPSKKQRRHSFSL